MPHGLFVWSPISFCRWKIILASVGERETRARLVSEWNQIGIVAALLATSAFGIAGTTANESNRPCTFRDVTDDILTPLCRPRGEQAPV